MKILLLSDTHGALDKTKEVLAKYQIMDAYIHLGDVGFDVKELCDFLVVCGNHDHIKDVPYEYITTFEKRKVLCLHGNLFDQETLHEVFTNTHEEIDDLMELCMNTLYGKLANYAKEKGCDCVFFGHTHHQCFVEKEGITLINPGSLYLGTPRNGYAIVEIVGNKINVCFEAV
ncbi:MAG: metallophosphoesterase family protein [Longicatena sp.]